jgi:DNA-binding NtrC family response regulator
MADAPVAEVPVESTRPTSVATVTPLHRKGLELLLPDGRSQPIFGRIRVGQSASNDVVLVDPHISRQHCEIVGQDARVIVRDSGSTNGTFVNGMRISREVELGGDSIVSLGRYRLAIRRPNSLVSPLVGATPAMVALRAQIDRLAGVDLPVLIRGETGTGKELVARALHDQSGRSGKFVALNCGAIPKELIESELFGHERGAFTGASLRRIGVFEEAHRGTLFLDELGELPLQLQTRLLRVLETGVVRPVGSARDVEVDVRIVGATHAALEQRIEAQEFREDLYYRVAGVLLHTTPLRERASDLPLLIDALASDLRVTVRFLPDAMQQLQGYRWPGNVRELRNVIRRSAALCGPLVGATDLDIVPAMPSPMGEALRVQGRSYDELEREILAKAIELAGGNKRAAALALKMPKSTLCDKAKRYGIG